MNAIITGATKGMGRAIAFKLAAAGYHLVICSRSAGELETFIHELTTAYPSCQVTGFPADCSDRASLQRFAGFVHEHFSDTDVLVNNAGRYIPSPLLDEDDAVLDDQLALNLFAPYYLSKKIGAAMRARGTGHIINICSIASLEPVAEAVSYSVTKFALLGLTNGLREELRPFGVKVTAVIPGATLTSSWGNDQPVNGTFITTEDIASAVLNCLQMSPGCNVDELIIRPLKRPLQP